jgi:hypothetical protein
LLHLILGRKTFAEIAMKQEYIYRYARRFMPRDLWVQVAMGLAQVESAWDENAVSPEGESIGLWQQQSEFFAAYSSLPYYMRGCWWAQFGALKAFLADQAGMSRTLKEALQAYHYGHPVEDDRDGYVQRVRDAFAKLGYRWPGDDAVL